jgi:hypothetical protein
MLFHTSFVLFLILLLLIVLYLTPKPVGWPRLAVWLGLVLITVLLWKLGAIGFG